LHTTEVLTQIDAIIETNSILKHPFYQAWQRGELSREALQDYATQYYHHVAAFPTYLSALHSHTADMVSRRRILENLIDEERGEENHPELWLRFAEAIGCNRARVVSSAARPETERFISEFHTLCATGSVAGGLAALYAYESQIPAVSETKIAGLRQFYGVDDPRGLQYFTVHKDADVEHSTQERVMLAHQISTGDTGKDCAKAAERVTTGLWGVLSGVCERHGIVC
jgi:pyrroloquinoline-quinone synthase